MMKSIMLALVVLMSAPAFADNSDLNSVGAAPAVADWHFGFGFGPNGPGFGFGWGPNHPGWGGHRPVQCLATNARGFQFMGYGRWPQEAQNNAMGQCYQAGSRFCQIRWCR